MNLLIDTHLLLWASANRSKLPREAEEQIANPANALWFSAASIWEVAIKRALDKPGFRIEAGPLRAGLLSAGYDELAIEGRHVLSLTGLPPHHADPFDRLLVAQAIAEGMTLLTADRELAAYGGAVRFVGG